MKKSILILSILLLCTSLWATSTETLAQDIWTKNPNVVKAQTEVEQAKLDVKDAKAGYQPTIDMQITGSFIGNPIDPIRVNLGDYINTTYYGINNDYITIYKGQEDFYYKFSLTLTQPLYTWGKIKNAVALYENVYDARILQVSDAVNKAQTELYTRLAALYYLNSINSILKEQETYASRLVTVANDARDNGMMLETDALKVSVQAKQIDVAAAQTAKQISVMETEIRRLTGDTSFTAADVEFDEEAFKSQIATFMTKNSDEVLTAATSDERTTLRLLDTMIEIQNKTKTIANASVNWKPNIALVVDANYAGSRLPLIETDWYGKDDWAANITVAIKTTIWDGGKAVRNVTRSANKVEEALIDRSAAIDQITSTLTDNLTNLDVSAAQIEYQEALVKQQEQSNSVTGNLYDSGYGSESDHLQGLIELNNSKIQILQNRINQAQAYYTLAYLTTN